MEDGNCTIKILFFAAAAEAVGTKQMELCVPASSTALEVCESIDSLQLVKSSCAFAIDHTLVSPETTIHAGCTLAILPPVSGG